MARLFHPILLAAALCVAAILPSPSPAAAVYGNTEPGTTNYPNAGLEFLGRAVFADDSYISASGISQSTGHAYFATGGNPPRIIKVATGGGAGPPVRLGELVLEEEENSIMSVYIEVARNFGFFGTDGHPGRVYKVDLGEGDDPPVLLGYLDLEPGENNLNTVVGIPSRTAAGGHLFFVTETSPSRVVKVFTGEGTEPPTRVGVGMLEAQESGARTAVVDIPGGHIYLGTRDNPARIVKVAAGADGSPPQRVAALTLGQNEYAEAGVLFPGTGHALFAVQGASSSRLIKVTTPSGSGAPVLVSSTDFLPADESIGFGLVNTFEQRAYFLGQSDPPRIIKVDPGSGAAAPTRIGAALLFGLDNEIYTGTIDTFTNRLFLPTDENEPRLFKLNGGSDPGSLPSVQHIVELEPPEYSIRSGVIDPEAGYAWFGLDSSPARIVTVAIGDGLEPPRRTATTILPPQYSGLISAVGDPESGHAWFGTADLPAQVVKVALGSGGGPVTYLGSAPGDAEADTFISAVIDTDAGYALFGTNNSPGIVVKFSLGEGSNPPERLTSLTLNPGENRLATAVYDPLRGEAYFGTRTTPASVVRVGMGVGEDITVLPRLGAITLEGVEGDLRSSIINPPAGYAWFGTGFFPGRVVKIQLESENVSMQRAGAVSLESGESSLNAAVFDPVQFSAWFSAGTFPGQIVKVGPGIRFEPPHRIGATIFPSPGDEFPRVALIDRINGTILNGLNTDTARVMKHSYSQKGYLKGTRVTVEQAGQVESVTMYSHGLGGNVRLSIYSDAEPKQRLWTAPPVPVNVRDGEITVPIIYYKMEGLYLTPGDYWITWQLDSTANIPSHTEGDPGEGFSIQYPFEAPPSQITSAMATETSDRWTVYLTMTSGVQIPPEARARGDFNNDGCVNFQDFVFLLDNWGVAIDGTPISFNDFIALLENWGDGC